MSEPLVLASRSGAVQTLTLNRPAALNSFTTELHAQLLAALEVAAADTNVRCVVLTGAGRGFCAGQDWLTPPLRRYGPGAAAKDLGDVIERWYAPLCLRLRSMPVPVVAAVNGVASRGLRGQHCPGLRSGVGGDARPVSSRRLPKSAYCPTAVAPGCCRAWWAAPTLWGWRYWATS